MHYKTDKWDYPVAGVDEFLRDKERVSQLDVSEVEFKPGALRANTQIIVLKPALQAIAGIKSPLLPIQNPGYLVTNLLLGKHPGNGGK